MMSYRYLSVGNTKPGCTATTFDQVTTWNDANGASFCYTGNGTTLANSDVIYARASYAWWSGGRVFSQRGDWASQNVVVDGLRVSDPLPSLNAFQFAGTGAADTNNTFKHVTIANFSTMRRCGTTHNGCNCQPACAQHGPLPFGVPNLLEGQVRHVTFDNVTIAGVSIADAFRGPSFNVSSTGSVSDIYVDGRKVI